MKILQCLLMSLLLCVFSSHNAQADLITNWNVGASTKYNDVRNDAGGTEGIRVDPTLSWGGENGNANVWYQDTDSGIYPARAADPYFYLVTFQSEVTDRDSTPKLSSFTASVQGSISGWYEREVTDVPFPYFETVSSGNYEFEFLLPFELLIDPELDQNIAVFHGNPEEYVFNFGFEDYQYSISLKDSFGPLDDPYADYAREKLGLDGTDTVYGWTWTDRLSLTIGGSFEALGAFGSPTPEPSSLALLILGAGLVALTGRRMAIAEKV